MENKHRPVSFLKRLQFNNDFTQEASKYSIISYLFCVVLWAIACLLFSKPFNMLIVKSGELLFSFDNHSLVIYQLALFSILFLYLAARIIFIRRFLWGQFPILKFGIPITIWYFINVNSWVKPELFFIPLPSVPNLNFLSLIYFFCLIDVLFMGIYYLTKVEQRSNELSSFLTDVAIDPKIGKENQTDKLGFVNFAKRIVEEIKNVSSTESVVFGINGEWGEGKTSMINLIRQQLEIEKYTVVDFHPWKTNSGKAMNQLFFDALKDGLENKIWGINWQIDRYANALLQLDKTGLSKTIWQLLFQPDSVEKQKEKLAQSMKMLDENLVVVVDDLDRLAKNEIADVLKLMRDTANFPNLVFLTAYDRAYLNKAIEKEINEHNYESYMDKIVLWEAPIYRPQPRKYLELLEDTLIKKLPEFKQDINKIFDTNSNQSLKVINDLARANNNQPNQLLNIETPYEIHIAIFRNLRTIKKFVNYLVFNIRIIQNDIVFNDFYYLYLLRHFYPVFYDSFIIAYYELFRVKKGSNDQIELDKNKYADLIFNQKENQFDDTKAIQISKAIISNILDNNIFASSKSLVYYRNFLNYFHLGNHNEITTAEFSAMMRGNNIDEIKPKIDQISKDVLNLFSNHTIIKILGDNFPKNNTKSYADYFKSMIWMALKCDHPELYKECHDRMEYLCSNKEFGIDTQLLQKELSKFILDEQIQSDFQYFIFLFSKNLRKYESYISKDFAFEITKMNFNDYISSRKDISPKLINLFYCSYQILDSIGELTSHNEIILKMKRQVLTYPEQFLSLVIYRESNVRHSFSPESYWYQYVDFLQKIFETYDEFVSFLKNTDFGNETEKAKIYLKYIDQAFPDKNLTQPHAFLPNGDDYKNSFAGLDSLDVLLDWKLRARIDEMMNQRTNQTN